MKQITKEMNWPIVYELYKNYIWQHDVHAQDLTNIMISYSLSSMVRDAEDVHATDIHMDNTIIATTKWLAMKHFHSIWRDILVVNAAADTTKQDLF